MTLQQLEYFLAALDAGSFSAAAEELRLAQPSLSEQVRKLEAELGVALFTRVGRGLVLTHAGHELRPHAERALEDVEAARDTARRRRLGLRAQVGRLPRHRVRRWRPGRAAVAQRQAAHALLPRARVPRGALRP